MARVPVTSHIRPNIELFTLLQTDKCLTHGMPFDDGDCRTVHFWDFLPFKSASVPEEDRTVGGATSNILPVWTEGAASVLSHPQSVSCKCRYRLS